MSPVAPMPHGAPVGTNGLKLWVMVDSGELSMTRVLPVALPVLEFVPPELVLLDEHAASPAASKPAAPTAPEFWFAVRPGAESRWLRGAACCRGCRGPGPRRRAVACTDGPAAG